MTKPIPSPPTEVSARPKRRTFTREYKVAVVEEAQLCTKPGQIGALLRREGLYHSTLSRWRRQHEQGQLATRPRGRPSAPANPLADELTQVKKEKDRLQRELTKARAIIEAQKKLSELLGLLTDDS